jgi:hypothetical protein
MSNVVPTTFIYSSKTRPQITNLFVQYLEAMCSSGKGKYSETTIIKESIQNKKRG